jgi:hypothetical protein
MNKLLLTKVLAVSAIASLSTGCASITQGTSQTLIFSIEPKETRCVLTRDGDGQVGVVTQSQNTVSVTKDKDDIIVQCKAEGYKPFTTRIVSSASGAGVTGAIFIDLGIVDLINGAMWRYPESHNINMEKEGGPTATKQTPSEVAQTEKTPQQ